MRLVLDASIHDRVLRLRDEGRTFTQVAASLGISRASAFRFAHGITRRNTELPPSPICFRCSDAPSPPPSGGYGYLLGQYLGDGHLVTSARIPVLRIYACTDYPHILRQIDDAVTAVRGRPPGHVFGQAGSRRVVSVQSYWNHWPCLLPQHGPGRKHTRPIVLTGWQRDIVDADPWPLIRGLIDSDGCRVTNSVVTRGKAYAYPRYFFNNESTDIIAIFTGALDQVEVEWKMNRSDSVSIARRRSVAVMDEHVGPKR
jgi:hypothetical protein